MGYGGLQDAFPPQQNLPDHFGEIRIHLQTFSYYYKPFLVLDPEDRGMNHLWFWLWKSVPFKGVSSGKRMQTDTEKTMPELLAVGDADHFTEEELLIPGLRRTDPGLQTELTFI